MLAKIAGKQALMRSARLGEQADDQGYTGGVDVIDLLEVEQDRLRVLGVGLRVSSVEHFLGEAVDFAPEVEDDAASLLAHLRLQMTHGHHVPPSARPSR